MAPIVEATTYRPNIYSQMEVRQVEGASWSSSEKDLLIFLTKAHVIMTGILLAMVVFLAGSKLKRIRRSKQLCKVKIATHYQWPILPVDYDDFLNSKAESHERKDYPQITNSKEDIAKSSNHQGQLSSADESIIASCSSPSKFIDTTPTLSVQRDEFSIHDTNVELEVEDESRVSDN